jgi:hypothetical protein
VSIDMPINPHKLLSETHIHTPGVRMYSVCACMRLDMRMHTRMIVYSCISTLWYHLMRGEAATSSTEELRGDASLNSSVV